MRTWDFFDTLLGRACGEPWRVFELMGGEEFKRLRQEAEQKSDKTFEGIYAALRRLTGWTAAKTDEYQQLEWEWEQRLAFPITANTRRVGAADLIITDTYFNQTQIRALANVIAIPQTVDIYASYGDKHTGAIWKAYRTSKHKITQHVGDNKHADYAMAKRHGIPCALFNGGAFTGFEKFLQHSGHWDVAAIARCVRLQNPYSIADKRAQIWQKHAAANVPFLLLIAAKLRQHIGEKRFERIAFVTRDTVLLHRVFNQLYPEIKTKTFYASRQTYQKPSDSFLKYVASAVTMPSKTLFVDLQGTGKSAHEFMHKHKIKMNYVFCTVPTCLPCYVPYLFQINKLGTQLEVFNYDTEGRVLDVVDGKPVRDSLEYDAKTAKIGHDVVDCLLKSVFQSPVAPTDEVFKQVFQQMHSAPQTLLAQHVHEHPHR